MRTLITTLLLLLALPGCSAEQSEMAVSDVAQQQAAAPMASRSASADEASAPAAPVRMVIRTASLTLVVTDAASTLQNLVSLVEARGGYLAGTRQWRENEQLRVEATLRVPEPALSLVLGEMRKAAIRVESESMTGEDVSEEFSDLGAQLVNLRATETELRELLTVVRERMQKASDILEIHAELTKIRGEIERIEGRRKYLTQMTSLATINVSLIPDALARPVVEPGWRPIAVVKNASRSLIASLKWIAEALIWLVVFVLPILIVIFAVLYLLRRIWRAFRPKRSLPAPPPHT